MTAEPGLGEVSANRRAQPLPFAYGLATTDNPWEGIVLEFCRGPDIVYEDARCGTKRYDVAAATLELFRLLSGT